MSTIIINGVSMNLTKEQINDLRGQLGIKAGNLNFPEFEGLGRISGYFIDENSEIDLADDFNACDGNKNIRATEEQAEACLALSQLSQLMKHVNGDWNPADDDNDTERYTIYAFNGEIDTDYHYSNTGFLRFPSDETRDGFLEAYRDLLEIAKLLL